MGNLCDYHKKITCEQRDKLYQCQVVKNLSYAQSYYQHHFKEYCSHVTECIWSQLKWYDIQLMRDIIFVVGTQGWEKAVEEESMNAIHRILEQFTVPLQGASANIEIVVPDCVALVQYAVQFILVSTLDYRAVWWCIFQAPNAGEWSKALILANLLLSSIRCKNGASLFTGQYHQK